MNNMNNEQKRAIIKLLEEMGSQIHHANTGSADTDLLYELMDNFIHVLLQGD